MSHGTTASKTLAGLTSSSVAPAAAPSALVIARQRMRAPCPRSSSR